MRLISLSLCIAVFHIMTATGVATADTGRAHMSRTYGAIDLGSRGVKAFLFQFVREGEGPDASVVYKNEVLTKLVSGAEGDKLTAAGIEEATQATTKLLAELRAEAGKHNLPAVEYYVVGSSGVARFANHDELKTSVDRATHLAMTFVDVRQEAYDGILSGVPLARRESSVMVDLGGSNTKMACLQQGEPHTAELPFGSVTLREAAVKANADYAAGVADTLRDRVAPVYAEQARKAGCIADRQRLYWLGGAAWATATFSHPEAALYGYVNLSAADINGFLTQLRNSTWLQHEPQPRFAASVKPDQRQKIEAAQHASWKRVSETFSREDLLAGVSLMKMILDSHRAPTVFFVRNGSYIFGYALEKFREDSGGDQVAGDAPSYFAGIDLGSRGVKAYVYAFVNEAEGPDARTLFRDEINTKLVSSARDNRFTQAGIDEATTAVTTLYGEMKDFASKRGIEPIYYIVGSSGVAGFANHDDLKAAVERTTELRLEFVDVRAEGLYGLVSAIPAARRQDALHVDIGGSNTKIGCLIRDTYNPVEIPFGSLTLRKAVPAGQDYAAALPVFAKQQVSPKYDEARMNTPCLESRSRIYLSGGAAWATATFVHPEAAAWGYVPLTRSDVDAFARRLADGTWNRPPQFHFGAQVKPADRAAIQQRHAADRKKVEDTFSKEDLMAGVALIRLVLDKGNPAAKVWFVRNGNYLFGYALKQHEGDVRFGNESAVALSAP